MSDANETPVSADSAFQLHCWKNNCKIITIKALGNEKKKYFKNAGSERTNYEVPVI